MNGHENRRLGIVQPIRGFVLIAAAIAVAPTLHLAAQDADDSGTATRIKPTEIQSSGGVGVIITIRTEITDVTASSVRRRIAQAREDGADVIIFELNTPGGLVSSTFDITDDIRNLTDIKTVAWINTTAHSGGAIVAISCNEIVTVRSSRMGDAQPIFGNPLGATAVPDDLKAKVTTPILGEVRDSARLRNYSQALCESLVDPDREVWWLENTETGERDFVFREEKMKRLGETEEEKRSEAAEEKTDESHRKKKGDDDGEDKSDGDPKEEADAAAESPSPTKETKWKLVESYYDIVLEREVDTIQPVVRSDQLLQMSTGEAFAYGFSKGVLTDETELKSRYGLTTLTRIENLWSESLALWMTSMWVRGFLLVIIMLGAYVEFHTPGVGVPGLVALICLGIFVVAPYLAGLANVWEILFMGAGLALIALEILVIPGFGIAGVSGIGLVLVGLLATFVPDEPGRTLPLYLPSLPSTLHGLKMALVTLVSSMVVSLLGMIMLSRYLPGTTAFRRIVPANPTPSEVTTEDPYRGGARVGDVGETAGPLHPTGKARFGGQLVDVVTQGEYLETAVTVEVIVRRGNHVVVRERKA